MSRLIKKAIKIPEGVTIKTENEKVIISGSKGNIELAVLPSVGVEIKEGLLRVSDSEINKKNRANSGTMWSLVKNAVEGVQNGFLKILEIEGVGYKANLEGNVLVLSVGGVNPIRYNPPAGITIQADKNTIKVSGINKELVGRVAAEIRSFKKPEPYKGKGIHYKGEIIKRKVGKKAGATGAIGS